MDLATFDTHDPAAPQTLAWGCIAIDGVRSASARVRCFVEGAGDDVAGVTFSDGAGATVQIRMYRLSAAAATLAADLKRTANAERAWPIPDGWPFVSAMLAPADMPAAWRHKAAQIYTNGPGIAHAFRGRSRAMLLQYALSGAGGDVLRNPLFHWVGDHLRVVPRAWHLAPPTERVELIDDDNDAVTERPADTSDRPLTAIERARVLKNARRARDAMGLHPLAAPDDVVRKIRDDVELLRRDFASMKPHVRRNASVSLGALWGEMLCKTCGWEWCGLTRAGGGESPAVVSHDRAYVVSPNDFLMAQLTQDHAAADNTVALLYNMIRAGKLPPARPRAYRMLG